MSKDTEVDISEAAFKYKTYRCEWQVQCGTVDQYGEKFVAYKTYAFPTHEAAKSFMPTVATESKYVKDRWIPNAAPHDCCEAQIVYREIEDTAAEAKNVEREKAFGRFMVGAVGSHPERQIYQVEDLLSKFNAQQPK